MTHDFIAVPSASTCYPTPNIPPQTNAAIPGDWHGRRQSVWAAIQLLFVAAILYLAVLVSGAFAQTAGKSSPEVPPQLQPAAINDLVSKLNPDQVAALTQLMTLITEGVAAKAPAAPSDDSIGIFATIKTGFAGFETMVLDNIRNFPELLAGLSGGISALVSGSIAGPFLPFLGYVAVIVGIGFVAEFLINRVTGRLRSQIRSGIPSSLYETVKLVSSRFLLDVGGLIAFALVALVAARMTIPDLTTRAMVLQTVFLVILMPRTVAAILRFALAPHRRELRLVTADDWTARFIYRNLVAIFAVAGLSFLLLDIIVAAGFNVAEGLRFFIGLGINLWVIGVIWKARNGLTTIILGDDTESSVGLARMAIGWPYFSMAFIAFNWFLVQFAISMGVETLTAGRSMSVIAIVLFTPFLDTMVRGIVSHIVPPMRGEGAVARAAHLATRHSYIRIARVALIAVLIYLVARIYGLNLLAFGADDSGSVIARDSVGFLLTLAAGYLAWEIANLWVSHQLAKDSPPPAAEDDDAEMGAGGKSRLATVLPLLRIVLQITIITMTVLLALGQVGVNITPLLAGAGVIGLAVGFGAQTLVRDVVSGIFFLMDDAFRLGEFIDVGGTMGSVEKISIRSLQLRGATGPVHIVPYGGIAKLTNLSRDWVIMKLKFTVPFDTDVEKVRKIFKKIGQEIREMPDFKEDILAPFKFQGVNDFDDVGIVLRGKFTTKPGKQFTVRKEIYKRVQQAFDENGIQFARKEVRVQLPGAPDTLSDQDKNTIAAAAAEAAQGKPAARNT